MNQYHIIYNGINRKYVYGRTQATSSKEKGTGIIQTTGIKWNKRFQECSSKYFRLERTKKDSTDFCTESIPSNKILGSTETQKIKEGIIILPSLFSFFLMIIILTKHLII